MHRVAQFICSLVNKCPVHYSPVGMAGFLPSQVQHFSFLNNQSVQKEADFGVVDAASSASENGAGPTIDAKEDSNRPRKKRKQNIEPELVKLSEEHLNSTFEIASIVVSLHEIASVTMSRDLAITSWQNYPISLHSKNQNPVNKIEEYYQRIKSAVEEIPRLQNIDLTVIEARYWKLSVPFLNSHFLITKSILHSVFSHGSSSSSTHRKVVYAPWTKTGKVFDLLVEGTTRKSGKEKTVEILRCGSWCGNPIKHSDKILKITDSNVKTRKRSHDGQYTFEPITEEMADSFLQALAFWTTACHK